MENTKYGKRREGQWTPIRAKAQDTRANPNSWETHLVRKRWDIGLLRALSPGIMMMMTIQINELELELELEDQFRYSCLFRSHTSCIIKGTWVRAGRLVIALNCQLAGRQLKSRYMLQIRTSSKNHNSLVTTFINSCHLFVPTSTLCMSYGPKQRNNNDHSFVI